VKGLRARGNFEINIEWKNRVMVRAEIKSFSGGICKVRSSAAFTIDGVNAKAIADKNGYVAMFNSKKGETYIVKTIR
jgi:alpha-L-fucosidase 2